MYQGTETINVLRDLTNSVVGQFQKSQLLISHARTHARTRAHTQVHL
jgi:hypothetical protein